MATGPIYLDDAPQEIAFLEPIRTAGKPPELCLEFDPPGGSRQAAKIHVVLLTTTGDREPWDHLTLDRRGEATVCIVAGASQDPATAEGPVYRGVELSSDVPVFVRQIRWGLDG